MVWLFLCHAYIEISNILWIISVHSLNKLCYFPSWTCSMPKIISVQLWLNFNTCLGENILTFTVKTNLSCYTWISCTSVSGQNKYVNVSYSSHSDFHFHVSFTQFELGDFVSWNMFLFTIQLGSLSLWMTVWCWTNHSQGQFLLLSLEVDNQ